MVAAQRYDGLNFDLSQDYSIQGKTCVIVGADDQILTKIYNDLTEGSCPSNEGEILLSNRSKELLDVKVGDQITLHTPSKEYHYTISGFGGDVTISDDADVVGAFVSWDAFQDLAKAEGMNLSLSVLYALPKMPIPARSSQNCSRPMDLRQKICPRIPPFWG